MNRYDVILIDADDTLFDFQTAEKNALAALLNELGLNTEEDRAAYQAANHKCWRALEKGELSQARLKVKRFEDFFGAVGSKHNPQEASERYIDLLSREGALLDGALEAVRVIAAKKPVAIVTNGIARIQRGRLMEAGLDELIDAVVISEELGAAKPDKRMIEAALTALGGVAPDRALMVGDSLESDIRCANNALVDACWLNRAGIKRPGDAVIAWEIRDIAELPEIALGQRI